MFIVFKYNEMLHTRFTGLSMTHRCTKEVTQKNIYIPQRYITTKRFQL